MNSARLGINVAEAQVFSPKLIASWTVASDAGESGTGRVGVGMTTAGFDIEPYVRFGYSADGTSRITGDPAADYTSVVQSYSDDSGPEIRGVVALALADLRVA